MEKDVIRGRQIDKVRHIGHRIKFYRECKELHIKLFAERCGMDVVEAMDVETGKFLRLNTALLLKISEVLGISYSDLFELDDGRYYSNVDSPDVVDYLFRKAKDTNVSITFIGKTLGVKKSTYHNWAEKKRIPSPFDMQNILSLLKIDADELSRALRTCSAVQEKTEAPAVEEEKEVRADSLDMMNEVVKAIEMYKNIGTLVAELDEIIEKAQKLKVALGGK